MKLTPQRSAKLGVKFGRKAVPDLDTLLGTMQSLPAVEFTKYIKEDTALEEYDEDSGAGSLMHAETLKMYRTGGICVLGPQQACQAQNVLNSSGSRQVSQIRNSKIRYHICAMTPHILFPHT